MKTSKVTLTAILACIVTAASAQNPPEKARPPIAAAPEAPEAPEAPQPPQALERPSRRMPAERPAQDRYQPGERNRDDPFGGGGGGGAVAGGYGQTFDAWSPLREMFGNPSRPLVVSSSAMRAEAVANFEEDIEVMARILEKAMERAGGQGRDQRYMGIVIPGFSGNRSAQNLYLEGYGALFILNVRFPLAPESRKQAEGGEDRSNSTWEQARREVRGTPPPIEGRAARYSEEKVNSLKKELIAELRNATNIRALKTEEAIVIVVTSDDSANANPFANLPARMLKTRTDSRLDPAHTESNAPARPATLTLRVKKSDVDALAAGKIEPADFQEKVTVVIY